MKPPAYLGLYDGAAEMEVGHLLAELHTGRFTGTSFELVMVAESPDPITSTVADHPQVVVHSRAQYLDRRIGDVDAPLSMLYALLALALVIGILGVVNTMALSVLERTREIGLLRALGLTRRQLRAAVRIESVLVVVFGGLFGIVGGYLLGAMFQRAALRTGLLDAAVPAGQLLLTLVALAAVGVAAAAWPARRATRINVLAAIATE